MQRRGFVLWIIPVFVGAFLVRTALVRLLRERPRAGASVDRWWGWVTLAAVLAVLVVLQPIVGTVIVVGVALALTSTAAVGSPFRPRWGRGHR